jgi:hypothetical protein
MMTALTSCSASRACRTSPIRPPQYRRCAACCAPVVALWRGLDPNVVQRTWRDCLSKHLSPELGASSFSSGFSEELDNADLLRELVLLSSPVGAIAGVIGWSGLFE